MSWGTVSLAAGQRAGEHQYLFCQAGQVPAPGARALHCRLCQPACHARGSAPSDQAVRGRIDGFLFCFVLPSGKAILKTTRMYSNGRAGESIYAQMTIVP